MRSYKVDGIILKRTNVGETDRILTIYTEKHGKIRAIAKGVRRITSRKGGSLELFNLVSLFISSGKNLDIITETSVVNSFSGWRKDLRSVGVAYYLCELIDKLTPDGQNNRQVFELLKESLDSIDKGNFSAFVRNFEENLLEELGFGVPAVLKQPGAEVRGVALAQRSFWLKELKGQTYPNINNKTVLKWVRNRTDGFINRIIYLGFFWIMEFQNNNKTRISAIVLTL